MSLLCDVIDLPAHPLISIVGAGSKPTTMYPLASELAQRGGGVITTTTTQIFFPEPGQTGALIVAAETPTLLEMISAAWQQYRRVTVAGAIIRADKLAGLQPGQPYELLMQSGARAVIIEPDGPRHRLIKPPAHTQPDIPTHTTI